jgi:hypothetical protein
MLKFIPDLARRYRFIIAENHGARTFEPFDLGKLGRDVFCYSVSEISSFHSTEILEVKNAIKSS